MPKCTSARCNSRSAIPGSPLSDTGRATDHTCRQEAYRAGRIMRMDGYGVNSQSRFVGLAHGQPDYRPWCQTNTVAAPGTPELSGGRMGLFIMCLQQVLAKTIGRIMPDAVHMIGPILRVIVLND